MSRDEEFTAYVAERRPHLYRAAYLLCGSTHRAEDLVQTALTNLYVAWPRAQRAESVDAYVRRILVNSHLDETRRPWRREQVLGEPPERPATPEPREEADDLWAALRGLPAGQRRVVVLRHYWGLSVAEAAADLGVSTGTVKSQTSSALATLRAALEPNPQGGAR